MNSSLLAMIEDTPTLNLYHAYLPTSSSEIRHANFLL